jgi:hypothetical protein
MNSPYSVGAGASGKPKQPNPSFAIRKRGKELLAKEDLRGDGCGPVSPPTAKLKTDFQH